LGESSLLRWVANAFLAALVVTLRAYGITVNASVRNVRETALTPRRVDIGYGRAIDEMGGHIMNITSDMAPE
jgi:hypothetical protein